MMQHDHSMRGVATRSRRAMPIVSLAVGLLLGSGVAESYAQGDPKATYNSQCATCHRPDLSGGQGPALSGQAFKDKWKGKDGELKAYIQKTMPPTAPGSLKEPQLGVITSYILEKNGMSGGK